VDTIQNARDAMAGMTEDAQGITEEWTETATGFISGSVDSAVSFIEGDSDDFVTPDAPEQIAFKEFQEPNAQGRQSLSASPNMSVRPNQTIDLYVRSMRDADDLMSSLERGGRTV